VTGGCIHYGYGKYGNIIGISWDLTIKYRYFHVVSMEYIYIYIFDGEWEFGDTTNIN
jgi:hypothetical protein